VYLQQCQQRANEICKQNEGKFDPQGVRDRIAQQYQLTLGSRDEHFREVDRLLVETW
jgi:hypothetical protein